MHVTLLHTIYSYTRKVYGVAGEKVLVVGDHINVLIVKGTTGTFPVHLTQVKFEGETGR